MTNTNPENNLENKTKNSCSNKENNLEMFRQLYYESQNEYNSNVRTSFQKYSSQNNPFNGYSTFSRILL